MSIKLVTQSENAIELNCKFNGNIDLKAPIQQQAGGAVRYDTPQTLTDTQKLQARENIGALDKYNGMTPVECSYINFISQEAEITTLYVSQGTLIPPSEDASEEVKNAWNFMFFVPFGSSYSGTPKNAQGDIRGIALLAENGVFGADFLSATGNTFECSNNVIGDADKMRIIVSSASSKTITVFLYSRDGTSQQMTYSISSGTFNDYAAFSQPLKKSASKSSAEKLILAQVEMAADPTTDMQIATKRYVDEKVNSASGSGSDIKSIALTTNTIPSGNTADYKEALTYLWGNGNAHSIDLSQCIITVDGVVVNYVYVHSPYIYFYVPISANFGYDNLRGLNKYYYFCNYTEAMAATSDYKYIKRADYAATLLTSDNYSQYISAGGATYTEDIGDSNLYNAKEVYIHIVTSDGRTTSINIRVPQNYVFGEKANDYYYFPESESSNGYLWYDGSSFNISGSNYIDYIYYN